MQRHLTDCRHCRNAAEQLSHFEGALGTLLAEAVLGWGARRYLDSARPGGTGPARRPRRPPRAPGRRQPAPSPSRIPHPPASPAWDSRTRCAPPAPCSPASEPSRACW
ncbi:hypothetical protein ACR6C2_03410 [Streptomyces sp. INA 01156]